jgi:hypothetical protein
MGEIQIESSYLLSSRGEAMIPYEIKEQIQTFIEQNKDLRSKPLRRNW